MKEFRQNHCRICKDVFCCVDCREKHEKIAHHIDFPDCNICVYGRTYIADASDKLLQHIKDTHCPLNCLVCKKVYTTIEDILTHKKCELPPPTPNNLASTNDYDSPPITTLIANNKLTVLTNIISSTPMQENSTKKMPVNPENQSIDLSQINLKSPAVSTKDMSLVSTSKVTFSITPCIKEEKEDKEDNKKEKETIEFVSPGDIYSSLTDNKENEENGTLWESAIENNASINDSKIFKVTPIIDKFTPISMNLKKRKKQNLFDVDSPKNDAIKEEEPNEQENIFASTKLCVSQNDSENENGNKKEDKVFDEKKEISEIKCISNEKDGLWTSMSRIVKNVVGLSQDFCNASLKRSHSESELGIHHFSNPEPKRYKFNIRGRKPIRDISVPLHERLCNSEERVLRQLSVEELDGIENNVFVKQTKDDISKEERFYFNKKVFVDKATQTD